MKTSTPESNNRIMSNTHAPRMALAIPLGLMSGLGPLCIDLYLPALPQLANDLSVPTASAQLSLTAGLLGLGLGQLLFGPLSDKYGRVRPLIFSLIILLLASIACAFAQSLPELLIARVFQGLGGAGGAVLSRAVARDRFSGHELTRFFAMLMLVNGLAPIIAPVFGGMIVTYINWRGIFIVLAVISLLLLYMAKLKVTESLPVEKRSQGSVFHAWKMLGAVIRHRPFMGLCLTQGFMMSGMFAYIGASPFVFQTIYGLSPQQFSLCFALNGLGLILASQISARLAPKFGEPVILRVGLLLAFIAGSVLLVTSLFNAPLLIILIALFFTIASSAVISTTAASLAMQSQGQRAGSASAVIGVTMFSLGSIAVPISGLGGTSLVSMSGTIFSCFILAIMMFVFVAKQFRPAK